MTRVLCTHDCESCTLLTATNPASTEASDLDLTRGTYFVANRLEYVIVLSTLHAVDVLLWRMWWCGMWCVLRAGRCRYCFRFYPCQRTRPTACITSCETKYLETLIGRMSNTRNTRSSSYPQRRSQVMTVCILESYWVGAHAARFVYHTV